MILSPLLIVLAQALGPTLGKQDPPPRFRSIAEVEELQTQMISSKLRRQVLLFLSITPEMESLADENGWEVLKNPNGAGGVLYHANEFRVEDFTPVAGGLGRTLLSSGEAEYSIVVGNSDENDAPQVVASLQDVFESSDGTVIAGVYGLPHGQEGGIRPYAVHPQGWDIGHPAPSNINFFVSGVGPTAMNPWADPDLGGSVQLTFSRLFTDVEIDVYGQSTDLGIHPVVRARSILQHVESIVRFVTNHRLENALKAKDVLGDLEPAWWPFIDGARKEWVESWQDARPSPQFEFKMESSMDPKNGIVVLRSDHVRWDQDNESHYVDLAICISLLSAETGLKLDSRLIGSHVVIDPGRTAVNRDIDRIGWADKLDDLMANLLKAK